MEETDVVENFHGVYLLRSSNPKYKGRTYIGYTVNPNRRVKQHNKGTQYGGACRTSSRGPWDMILTVHGFPSNVAALRFEWAWQHPKRSRRLKSQQTSKKSSESSLDYCLRVMWMMLGTAPWCRLPLTLRWLQHDFQTEPPPGKAPPAHMPIVHGPVASKKLKSPQKPISDSPETPRDCAICKAATLEAESLSCLDGNCRAGYHVTCLARRFLTEEAEAVRSYTKSDEVNLLPVEGTCVVCSSELLWGDLVRKKKGCYESV